MKPKLALKLVPISGLVFDLHTATLLALWGGKASHVQQYKPKRRRKEYLENEKCHLDRTNMVSTRKTKAETTETPKKNRNNGKQTTHNTAKKENTNQVARLSPNGSDENLRLPTMTISSEHLLSYPRTPWAMLVVNMILHAP